MDALMLWWISRKESRSPKTLIPWHLQHRKCSRLVCLDPDATYGKNSVSWILITSLKQSRTFRPTWRIEKSAGLGGFWPWWDSMRIWTLCLSARTGNQPILDSLDTFHTIGSRAGRLRLKVYTLTDDGQTCRDVTECGNYTYVVAFSTVCFFHRFQVPAQHWGAVKSVDSTITSQRHSL